jgi:hypothetical protein
VINVQQAVLEMLAGNNAGQSHPTPLNVNASGGGAARSRTDPLNIKEIVLEMLSVNSKNQAHAPDAAAGVSVPAGTTVKNRDGSVTVQV